MTGTRYEEEIAGILSLVASDAAPDLTAEGMARRMGFSQFHFSRMFSGMVGESPGEFLRRIRLEKAARALRTTAVSVTEAAFDAGFESLEGFARAFRSAYGQTASEFRRGSRPWTLTSPNEVHYNLPFRFLPRRTGTYEMNAEILKDIPSRRVVAMRHVGPYNEIGAVFGRLMAWCQEQGVQMVGPSLAIYHDDPGTVAPSELRSDACAEVASDFHTDDPRVEVLDVPGGSYAVATHLGSYSGLGEAWNRFMGEWLPASGATLDFSRPCFELYVNDCSTVDPAEVRTDLYEPVV